MTMKNCPTCGALLAANLVAAIIDPKQPESCPKVTPAKKAPEPVEERKPLSLATLMIIGSMVSNSEVSR